MGARQKLNQAYVHGALCVAVLVGVVTESWLVFGITFVVTLASSYYAGEIRPKGRNRRK